MTAKRLALGTVQFGLPYGVANEGGQVPLAEAQAIVEQARKNGLDTVDTAIAYGDSEERLGRIGLAGWRVITKLPPLPDAGGGIPDWVRATVADSLERLRVKELYGLLLHRADDLLAPSGEEAYAALVRLKRGGLVRKIGVSIHGPEILDKVIPRFSLDLIQAPFNVLDRRLLTSGWLAALKKHGLEVHTRSVFLQGLLLMKGGRRPGKFDRWSGVWNAWSEWLAKCETSPARACLGFPLQFDEIDRVVIGVDSAEQLSELLLAAEAHNEEPPPELCSHDLDLIDPSRWSSL